MEDICVFYKRLPVYHPQGIIKLDNPIFTKPGRKSGSVYHDLSKGYYTCYSNYPKNLLEINCERGLHPTQKPVELFEYLIKTYTNPGDLVLDNCMGSGTTKIACMRSGRNYTGFETDEEYFNIAVNRQP